ncbi:MAG: MFS transporter [Armatimonadota bacterium]|nr:MFS transporter [Armatimonadota bacterium]MDW8156302.1 MFS transporter [Armatimonadota bacterium]
MATLQQAGLTFVRFGLPALVPFVRADLRLSLAEAGVVLGAFDLGALVAFYATGLATERAGERRVMAAGAVATGLLAALGALAPSAAWLAAALALAGAGFPSSQVAGSHAVMAAFPARERGVAMGVRQAGLPVGGLLAAFLLPWLASVWSWRVGLLAAGVGCALAGVLTYTGLGRLEAPHEAPGVVRPAVDPWRAPLEFFRSAPLVLTTLTACLLAAGQFGLTGYLPLYFVDTFGWQPQRAARLLLFVHLGGVAGRMAWGWVSDRWFGADRTRPIALAACCAAATVVALALLARWEAVPAWAAAVLALLSGFTLLGWNGLYVTLLSELAWAWRASAVMVGLSMTVLYVFTMLAPPVFGWTVERMGGHYTGAWLGVVALQLLAAGTVSGVRRNRQVAAQAPAPGE